MATKKKSATIGASLEELLANKGGKYLSDFEKKEFSEQGTEFFITGIEKTDSVYQGQKRKRWEVEIEYGKTKGRVIAIPTHELRDETFDALASLVVSKGKQGPVVLRVREMENGHTWLTLNAVRKGK